MPPSELVDARREVVRAREVAGALDPTDVHEADVALRTAEGAWEREPDSPSSIDLALVATRKAQLAEAEASAAQAMNRVGAAKLRAEEMTASALDTARGRLGETERQLTTTQDELRRQQEAERAQGQRLQEMEDALKQARATIAKIASVRDDDRGMIITLQSEVLFKTGQADLKPGAMAKSLSQ
jgi:flagellar motor protein MotB